MVFCPLASPRKENREREAGRKVKKERERGEKMEEKEGGGEEQKVHGARSILHHCPYFDSPESGVI